MLSLAKNNFSHFSSTIDGSWRFPLRHQPSSSAISTFLSPWSAGSSAGNASYVEISMYRARIVVLYTLCIVCIYLSVYFYYFRFWRFGESWWVMVIIMVNRTKCHKPWWLMRNHKESSWIISNHRELSWIIMNHSECHKS